MAVDAGASTGVGHRAGLRASRRLDVIGRHAAGEPPAPDEGARRLAEAYHADPLRALPSIVMSIPPSRTIEGALRGRQTRRRAGPRRVPARVLRRERSRSSRSRRPASSCPRGNNRAGRWNRARGWPICGSRAMLGQTGCEPGEKAWQARTKDTSRPARPGNAAGSQWTMPPRQSLADLLHPPDPQLFPGEPVLPGAGRAGPRLLHALQGRTGQGQCRGDPYPRGIDRGKFKSAIDWTPPQEGAGDAAPEAAQRPEFHDDPAVVRRSRPGNGTHQARRRHQGDSRYSPGPILC